MPLRTVGLIMSDEGMILLKLAVEKGMMTERQSEQLCQELDMFPGQKLASVMLSRNYITIMQLADLRKILRERELAAGTKGGAKAVAAKPSSRPDLPPVGGESKPAHQLQRPRLGSTPIDQPKTRHRDASRTATIRRIDLGLGPQSDNIAPYLKYARQMGASDLHIAPLRPPMVRKHGELYYLQEPPLTPERSKDINFSALNESQAARVIRQWQVDFPLEISGLGRHRANVYHQRLGWEGSYRIIQDQIMSIQDLRMPPEVVALTNHVRGLIIITGPAGSGKTTTLAALVNHINETRTGHIVTVEDPIEYVIPPKRCQITQRDIGEHTTSFATALRAALRQDPDVIVVGELRDHETAAISISAAETGHLVFGTLHTSSATRTVSRLIEVFPASQRAQICTMVAESLRGVICQQLIPRIDVPGFAMALEVLIFTSGVIQQIKEGKTHQLPTLIQSSKKQGMLLMDESLMELYQAKIISGREAFARAENKPLFESFKDS
ncbi:MAG: PilT/PilU family type 4a pilus ATPase [Candidatus Sumerlaeaceae bacterium]|nr:PilT/PilU family type 4a pilus ATPase [Candidatus Sumerlaeaceae bacterium]